MVLTALALPVAAVLGYAWVDGGRQPMHDVVESLPIRTVPHGGKP